MTGFNSKRDAAADKLQEPVVKVVSTAPKHIWLDIGFNPQDEAEVAFHELYDVTWSEDNASGYGIEYVRADITPPQPAQEPLSDDSIFDIADYYLYNGGKSYGILEFARAIEAAHGIKGNT